MRVTCPLLFAAFCAAFAVATPARAQTGPVIVVPGKPGVPVIIDGLIADGAVVYGDWGLAKPNNAGLTIVDPIGYSRAYDQRGYFPATGRAPRLGRLEVEPPPRRRPSTNYHRDWSIESDQRAPVTTYPPYDPPQVLLAPDSDRRRPWRPYRRGLLPKR